MYKFPSAKGFRRRTRLENTGAQLEKLTKLVTGSVEVLGVYADPKNWQATDETKDVKNETGLVVGVERVHMWAGPGSGPELAGLALRKILGVPTKSAELKQEAK